MPLILIVVLLLLTDCATPPNSARAREELENTYSPKVGSARKADLMEKFGSPQWCRPQDGGGEECRFYIKKGTKWVGDSGRDKKSYEAFDALNVQFDAKGVLSGINADAQR